MHVDGMTELLELDLFEVSVVPHPAKRGQLRARSMAAIADIDRKRHRPITIVSFSC